MNDLTHHVLTIEFDTWQPFDKLIQLELDDLLSKIRARELLGHAGNVRSKLGETRIPSAANP